MTGDQKARLDTVCRVAEQSGPPALADGAGQVMVRQAIAASRRKPWPGYRWLAFAAAAGAAVLLALLLYPDSSTSPPTRAAPLELTLPGGDRIAAVAGARFELVEASSSRRFVDVVSGELEFSVRPLAGGDSFEVRTPHLVATVVGTVFAVDVEPERTVVSVREGRVEVVVAGVTYFVASGEVIDSATVRTEMEMGRVAEAETESESESESKSDSGSDSDSDSDSDLAGPAPGGRVRGSRSATRQRPEPEAAADALADARTLIAAGEFTRALEVAVRNQGGDWRMLAGDALRGLRRYDEAAASYRTAADQLSGERAAVAGFLAAELYAGKLDDPAAALAALTTSGADRPGVALEERALGLRLRILAAADDAAATHAAAQRYLERFPKGSLSDWARTL